VRLLLDPHTLLWFLRDDHALSATEKAEIENPANEKFVSIATCWEIALKAGVGKLSLGEPASVLLGRELPRNNFDLPEITLFHATTIETLPAHHEDPFDRLLIVQSQTEGLQIVTVDHAFDAYGVARIW
jgi:PIN domain nuclease of toxin-antitoxin system